MSHINRIEFLNAVILAGINLTLPTEEESKRDETKSRIFFLEGAKKDLEVWAIDEEGHNFINEMFFVLL
jgi:hypothetical protein